MNGPETPMNFSSPSGEECGPLLTRAPARTTRHRSTAQIVSASSSTTRRQSFSLNILQDNIAILGNEFIRVIVEILSNVAGRLYDNHCQLCVCECTNVEECSSGLWWIHSDKRLW